MDEIWRRCCPVCGAADFKTLPPQPVFIGQKIFAPVADRLGLARCRACGVALVSPRPPDALLRAFYSADGYDCHDANFEAATAGGGEAARLKIIGKFIGGGSLLDFGAGAGHLLRAAREAGWRAAGVELGDIARERLSGEGFAVSPSLEGLNGERFDVVTMVHVLEHLIEPPDILTGIRACLKPGGLFYVEVPNADGLRARLATSPLAPLVCPGAARYLAHPIHLYHFNLRSLRILLTRAGFSILSTGTLGLGLDELRPDYDAPRAPAPVQSPAQPATPPGTSRFKTTGKNFVKATFSRFHWGENLYAVCRMS